MRQASAGHLALFLGVLFCCGQLPVFALAQLPGAAPGKDENLPIQIQADSGIEWQQNAHVYIARGNAVASRGGSEVHADTLIAHYRDVKGAAKPAPDGSAAVGANNSAAASFGANIGGNTEIYRVEAEGRVTLKKDTQTVTGDRAIYDVDRQIAVVTGKNLKMTTANDSVTARDSLEWFDLKQIAVARGDAVAIRNGKTVKGDILTAYMVKTAVPGAKPGTNPAPGKPAPASAAKIPAGKPGAAKAPGEDSKISRVDAQGHVVVTNGIDVGRADFGVYNAENGIATLIRNVVIERGKDVIRGQRGVMDLNNNVSRMLPGAGPDAPTQRVQGLFVREDKKNAASSAVSHTAPATTAAPAPAAPTGSPVATKKP